MSSTTTNTPAVAAGQAAVTNSQNSTMSPAQFYHTAKGQTPLLTASNYALWSRSIQFTLRAENLWQIVIGTDRKGSSGFWTAGWRCRWTMSLKCYCWLFYLLNQHRPIRVIYRWRIQMQTRLCRITYLELPFCHRTVANEGNLRTCYHVDRAKIKCYIRYRYLRSHLIAA